MRKWKKSHEKTLIRLRRKNVPYRVIEEKLNRTGRALQSKFYCLTVEDPTLLGKTMQAQSRVIFKNSKEPNEMEDLRSENQHLKIKRERLQMIDKKGELKKENDRLTNVVRELREKNENYSRMIWNFEQRSEEYNSLRVKYQTVRKRIHELIHDPSLKIEK